MLSETGKFKKYNQDEYKAAKQALLEGLGLSHLFAGDRKLTPKEKEIQILVKKIYLWYAYFKQFVKEIQILKILYGGNKIWIIRRKSKRNCKL